MNRNLLIIILISLVITTAGCATKYQKFTNENMSFEYPENWEAMPILDDVSLTEREGDGRIFINPTLEDLESFKSWYGQSAEYVGEEKIGGVTCYKYKVDHGGAYIFQKINTVFLVVYGEGSEDVAKHIIETLNATYIIEPTEAPQI
ncbi:hypothetical protein ISG34_03660 [Methanothermobacter marburgensis]|uniref:Lipoprotein n=1 Tax=Methanothermobacter marburgensis (strain ATCC BAA-927 / DSM 2133 / JCM 14651 / NBRC 100331 / OCM 82 / Marburg) TaxID=79929 RepID=D9PVT4_METTM|nr:hypothetical protein [Methanothermobacter marburgensis]ADL58332.1 hypothetical protein MTBMA_c07370 [Methanothermobacter marburgensis str. Marburg]WBF10484.1 hypothetical protein ISG34_03660 [Methanothermobacter marburgensis]